MGWFDSITPDFSDPNTMAAFGALGGVLNAGVTPRFGPNGGGITGTSKLDSIAGLLGGGLQGMNQGANFAQQYKAENLANQQTQAINPLKVQAQGQANTAADLANQSAALNLQRQQVMQPIMMKQLQDIGVNTQNLSSTDQMGAMGLTWAYGSGNPEQISKAYLTLYEHNPVLAGQIKAAQEASSVHETPQGPQYGVSGLPGAPAVSPNTVTSALTNGIVNSRTPSAMGPGNQQTSAPTPQAFGSMAPQIPGGTPAPMNPQQIQAALPNVGQQPSPPAGAPPVQSQQPQVPKPISTLPGQPATPQAPPAKAPISAIIASDGKPYTPQALALPMFKPDPTGTPAYNTPNTTTGVAQTKAFQSADIEGNAAISESVNNTNQMLARLNDIKDAYSKAQSGTFLAQDPELANKFIAAGVLSDKGTISNVAEFQRIQADQALEVLNQLKSATAGSGGSKILNSEVKNATGKLGDPNLQPQAIQDIMAVSQGMANYNKDMAQGWQIQGGLGNRVAGGFTQRPVDYQQSFAASHNLDDYILQAKQAQPQIMGAPPTSPNVQDIVNELRKRGHHIK